MFNRKQYLDSLKQKEEKSQLYKRTVDIISADKEEEISSIIEDEFSCFRNKEYDNLSSQEDRYKEFINNI